jgi:phosphoribosyl 1,2-cyclic phosphodiesterase
MSLKFCVLASGSAGNASFLQAGDFGVLIDIGLGPRQIAHRLASAGANWNAVKAVLLTHTHSDHWNVRTLAHLKRHRIPIYCHAEHVQWLSASAAYAVLQKQGLIRTYRAHEELVLVAGVVCRPLPLRHDSGATFGFRFECAGDLFGHAGALGYVADLGCWDDELVAHLADVEALALEFNHDVEMQQSSGRHPQLIQRVLGDEGHLSNVQAVALLQAILLRSQPGRLRHLIQLHLSRDCNRPDLAARVAQDAVGHEVQVHTARQDQPGPVLHLGLTNGRP